MQRMDTRIEHSTFCSPAVADGDKIAGSLELEKLMQVCLEKYPSLSLGSFFFKRVSGSNIGGVIVQSSEGEAWLITPDLWTEKCHLEKSFQGLDQSFFTAGRLDLGFRAELKHRFGNKSIFFIAAPSSVIDGILKVRQIQSSVHEIKVLHRSDMDLDSSDLARIELPQISKSGFDGTIPKQFQIFYKTPKGNTTMIWTYDNDSVTDLKNNIAVKTSYLAAKQHLLNGGRSMQDCRTMQDYNIKSDSTIILNMRL